MRHNRVGRPDSFSVKSAEPSDKLGVWLQCFQVSQSGTSSEGHNAEVVPVSDPGGGDQQHGVVDVMIVPCPLIKHPSYPLPLTLVAIVLSSTWGGRLLAGIPTFCLGAWEACAVLVLRFRLPMRNN